ncbi:MAG: hypothetical protein ACFB02_02815 [Mastigocoleus sp.]
MSSQKRIEEKAISTVIVDIKEIKLQQESLIILTEACIREIPTNLQL